MYVQIVVNLCFMQKHQTRRIPMNKHQLYEYLKAAIQADTADEYEKECKRIVKELGI